jgi:hypothetical protein
MGAITMGIRVKAGEKNLATTPSHRSDRACSVQFHGVAVDNAGIVPTQHRAFG